ncbi:MAG: hypothetical protein B7Y99_05040 [Caulobacterales bacterium 32-69-10]|nr:MAG: hypothetical protein B7Y99_05040 [Caulobacterales bacterium 32-69-10]
MADIRIPRQSLTPTPAPVRPAVRAAQQAFFQAAAAGEQVGAARTAPPPQSAAPSAAKPAEADPQRPMRPGSLLDIKV